jgi:anti-anti-sigma factor
MSTNPSSVLVIDDCEDDYLLARRLLTKVSTPRYDVTWAETYEAGHAALLGVKHDACLLDHNLAGRSGLDLLVEVQAAGCMIPIIILTGADDQEIDLAAMKAGAAEYLVKGQFDMQLLERTLRYAIRHKESERRLKQYAEMLEETNQKLMAMHAEIGQLMDKNVELSTPLIPISDDVVVMPLIGTLDSSRAEQVLETLLNGIDKTRARVTILDVTGVPSVDIKTVGMLTRVANAVQLLGAQLVVTGIRPDVAQALVAVGANLSGIITRGTLQSGIAYATERS